MSVLTNTVAFIGKETANLVRDKAIHNAQGAEGIKARAMEIDEAVKKLESAARYATF